MMRISSLSTRLLLAASLITGAALLLAGWGLTQLFRESVEFDHQQRAIDQLDRLAAQLNRRADAQPGLLSVAPEQIGNPLPDPRFQRPYGGAYWLIKPEGRPLLSSRSWWDFPLPDGVDEALDETLTEPQRLSLPGPQHETLLFWWVRVETSEHGRVWLGVGEEAADLVQATQRFGLQLGISLGLLGLLLVAAALLYIRWGLRPLGRLQQEIIRVRETGQPLSEDHPREISPLVHDLNALLQRNRQLVDSARAQAGNLAHALKTPLAVLANQAAQLPPEQAQDWQALIQQMQRQIDLQMTRARAQAISQSHGRRCLLQEVLPPLLRTLHQLHPGIEIEAPEACDAALRVESHELLEMLGNLLENACQWADSQVRISVQLEPADVQLLIDDDGPGIPAERRAQMLQRGQRLDESRPGTGLGLAIADELAYLHEGRLELGESPLGGLRVRLVLPRAA